jgi:response regulator RpfG family c-di-GMP phosphodiesterase
MSDEFLFADDVGEPAATPDGPAYDPPGWKVLVVDDEPEVHSMTSMVLSDIRYRGRRVDMISAHSAKEARAILAGTPDIACILLDVVMETDDAGLHLVRHIRHDLQNTEVRIILRTGQPGQAPERDVIVEYDINDYKAKTELTAQKLFTTVIATLRSYEDIMALEMNRAGLQKIIDASASLFQVRSMQTFSSGVLTQLSALLAVEMSGILCAQRGSLEDRRRGGGEDGIFILAGSGEFGDCSGNTDCGTIDCRIMEIINHVLSIRTNVYAADSAALYIRTPNHREVVAYLHTGRRLNALDEKLVEVFCTKVSVGFDNIWLYEQLRRAHQATVVALADLAEYKDSDTGDHVIRVEDMTDRTARVLQERGHYQEVIDDLFLEQIGVASILHDVGKVSTPDSILQKPGPLDADELRIMQEHAGNGGAILERASNLAAGSTYLSLGAEIAACHHERWDGGGYPARLKGEEIPLSARIVAVVDVFDALVSRRPYKEPWPVGEALAYIRDAAGSQFDPKVVEAFLVMMASRGMTPRQPSPG